METGETRKDFLTGFFTRESLVSSVNELRASYETYKKAFSILLVDIDRFKSFNDKYGHLIGDEVIKYFSSSIRLNLVAESTTLFRFGGDEFLILFHAADANEADALGGRLLDNVKGRPCNIRGSQLQVSFSGGIASYPADGQTAEELIEKADKALYSSKKSGRGQITRYSKLRLKYVKFVVMLAVAFVIAALVGVAIKMNFSEKLMGVVDQGVVAAGKLRIRTVEQLRLLKKAQDARSKKWSEMFISRQPIEQSLIRSIGVDNFTAYTEGRNPASEKFLPEVETRAPVAVPESLDTIYLKSGGVIRGRIISETAEKVTVELSIRIGRGAVVLKRSDIETIVKSK